MKTVVFNKLNKCTFDMFYLEFISVVKSFHSAVLLSGRGGKKGAVECCPNCRGTGMQIRIHQIGPGMVQQIQSVCMECQGHGERISPKDRCKSCTGRKIVREKKILEVHIDKGKSFEYTLLINLAQLMEVEIH